MGVKIETNVLPSGKTSIMIEWHNLRECDEAQIIIDWIRREIREVNYTRGPSSGTFKRGSDIYILNEEDAVGFKLRWT